MSDEPDEHVPLILLRRRVEPPRGVEYGIGVECEPRSWGMTHGPFSDLNETLETTPLHAGSAIIRFNADHTEDVLYRWTGHAWRKA